MSKRHKLVWDDRLRWSVKCSCSWGHLSSSRETAEDAVARHLAEDARRIGQQTLGAPA